MENFINKVTRIFNSGDIKTFEQTLSWCNQFLADFKASLENARTAPEVHVVKTPDQIRLSAEQAMKDYGDRDRPVAAITSNSNQPMQNFKTQESQYQGNQYQGNQYQENQYQENLIQDNKIQESQAQESQTQKNINSYSSNER